MKILALKEKEQRTDKKKEQKLSRQLCISAVGDSFRKGGLYDNIYGKRLYKTGMFGGIP